MARIVCFTDSPALVRAVRVGLSGREHAIYPLPSSRLTEDLRRTVRQLAPDVVLLELNHALDNPHLFIFLRADDVTRDTPIIVLSPDPQLDLYASALGADSFLSSDISAEQLCCAVDRFAPRRVPAAPPVALPLPVPAPLPAPALHPALAEAAPSRPAQPRRLARHFEPRFPTIPALIPALALGV